MFQLDFDGDLHEALRESEVAGICGFFAPGSKILELGGGDGLQARVLADAGFEVTSIDIPSRQTRGKTLFPVLNYDGRTIPFGDAAFDGVFSSNVLEHIPDLSFSLSELHRVLKVGGIGVHILPTPVWRFWTTLVHYPWLFHHAFTKGPSTRDSVGSARSISSVALKRSSWSALVAAVTLGFAAHGEYPNAVAELHYFRKAIWENAFKAHGFEVASSSPTGIFYTGQLLISRLPVSARRSLARLLGSACHVFVTRIAGT